MFIKIKNIKYYADEMRNCKKLIREYKNELKYHINNGIGLGTIDEVARLLHCIQCETEEYKKMKHLHNMAFIDYRNEVFANKPKAKPVKCEDGSTVNGIPEGSIIVNLESAKELLVKAHHAVEMLSSNPGKKVAILFKSAI